MRINKYIIKFENDKQLFYRLFYILDLVKLKTIKTYIKTNLVHGFILHLKSLASTSILLI